MREGWDGPRGRRGFMLAALAVALVGTVRESRRPYEDVADWGRLESSAALRGDEAAPGAAASSSPPSAPSPEAGSDARETSMLWDGLSNGGFSLKDSVGASGGYVAASAAGMSAGASAAAGGTAVGGIRAAAAAAALPPGAAPSPRERSDNLGASWVGARPAAPSDSGRTAVAASTDRRGAATAATPAERLFADASSAAGWTAESLTRRKGSGATAPAAKGRAEKEPRARRGRRLRPALLSKVLGRALRAPPEIPLPRERPWAERKVPATDERGAAVVGTPLGFDAAEEAGVPPGCGRLGTHWDRRKDLRWFHEKDGLLGRASPDGWAWARRGRGGLWLWPAPRKSPVLRHQGHWWMRSRELWFLVHEGAPWGARFLPEWGQLGFVHPSGSQMIYSADGTKVGMIEPGFGAIVYDAVTGRELGRWTADQLPARPAVPLKTATITP